MATITFNRNSNIFDYNVQDVIKCIKQEKKSGIKSFFFDSNFSAVHFFNYFIELLEQEESLLDAKIVNDYLDSYIKRCPKEYNEIVDTSLQLLELDEDIKKIFAHTTPQVICAFLYNNFAPLIYDEFFFFYDKVKTLNNLKKTLKIENVSQILYEIILAASYKLKNELKNKYEKQEFKTELTPEDLEHIEKSPKDIKEAIDWLLNAVETKSKNFKSLTISEDEPVDILTCGLFSETYHVLFFGWGLHYEKSPLRKWFKKNRHIDDPYYICYYIIRNFVNFLILKNSIGNGI